MRTIHRTTSGTARAADRSHAVRSVLACASLAIVASCSDRPAPTGPQVAGARRLAASDVTVTVLAAPSGVIISEARGVSAAGYIFGISVASTGASTPYAWTRPYSSAPTRMAQTGAVGGLDGPNDVGSVRGAVDGAPGYWSPTSSGWSFTPVAVGPYTGVTTSGVNDAGAMSGWGTAAGLQRALWWSGPAAPPIELPIPAVSGTVVGARALALNNAGAVVGELRVTTGTGRQAVTHAHGIVWSPGAEGWTATVLPDAGGDSRAYDVNDAGQIAGNGGSDAVLWSDAGSGYAATVVAVSQGALSQVDACGRVIGYTSGSSTSQHRAFVWENGTTTVLPIPVGKVATEAEDIGADPTTGQGVIVGRALDRKGTPAIVRWTIPGCAEPAPDH